MTAKEFRTQWLKMNPNTVHIPSEHEIGLMVAYASHREEVAFNAGREEKQYDDMTSMEKLDNRECPIYKHRNYEQYSTLNPLI